MICQECGKQLPPTTATQPFKDAKGKQEYHTGDMARWLAGVDGRAGDVVKWHMSARGSKEGLVTGYEYVTGDLGMDGLGRHCSIECQVIAAKRDAAAITSAARPEGPAGMTTPAARELARSPASGKALPGAVSGRRLRQIRNRLGMSTVEFARSLGYEGQPASLGSMIRRFECGMRTIDTARGRLAMMYEAAGVPWWDFPGEGNGAKSGGAAETKGAAGPTVGDGRRPAKDRKAKAATAKKAKRKGRAR